MRTAMFCGVAPCSLEGITCVSKVITASIVSVCEMVETVSTSETSIGFYQTTRVNSPKESINTHRRESLKSRSPQIFLVFLDYKFEQVYNLMKKPSMKFGNISFLCQ
jgi:hypothetical protein